MAHFTAETESEKEVTNRSWILPLFPEPLFIREVTVPSSPASLIPLSTGPDRKSHSKYYECNWRFSVTLSFFGNRRQPWFHIGDGESNPETDSTSNKQNGAGKRAHTLTKRTGQNRTNNFPWRGCTISPLALPYFIL